MQKERVKRIVLRYKIGAQSAWKKNRGSSPRNPPTMPSKGVPPPPPMGWIPGGDTQICPLQNPKLNIPPPTGTPPPDWVKIDEGFLILLIYGFIEMVDDDM